MYKTNLRKVRGSVMLAVPPALLDILSLRPGVEVGITVEGGRLVVEPQQRPRYTMEQLLTRCSPRAARTKKDHQWLSDGPAGAEIL